MRAIRVFVASLTAGLNIEYREPIALGNVPVFVAGSISPVSLVQVAPKGVLKIGIEEDRQITPGLEYSPWIDHLHRVAFVIFQAYIVIGVVDEDVAAQHAD